MLGELGIQFDACQAGPHAYEPLGEYPEARTDLQKPVGVCYAAVADDTVGHAVVYQKVLTLALLGHDAR